MRPAALRRTLAATVCLAGTLTTMAASARAASPPSLTLPAATLIEQSTGQQLFGLGADRQLPIASTTKLMTALLTLERAKLNRVFAEPDYSSAPADSQIGLAPGERMSVHDLLLALLLPSADDAAEDLAYNVGGGSVRRFIAMMNQRARELGLVHTHYATPIGFDTPGNYSSASDLVRLASFLLATQPFFGHAVSLSGAVLRTGQRVRLIANRNDLVGRVAWINGVKTGHTLDAGYVLVGSGTRGGMTLLSAVLGASSPAERDASTLSLLQYGFENFHLATPVSAGQVIARPSVLDRPGVHVEVIAGGTLTRVVAQSAPLSTRVELPHQLAGPLRRHAVVGTMLVLAGTQRIASIRLLLARALPAVSDLALAARFIARPSTLVVIAVLLGAVTALAVGRRKKHGRALKVQEPA